MLPPPALSFTIPSIHDDLVLQCRLYHPSCLAPTTIFQIKDWRKRAAIVAHPYAPLGGSYDDPIVDIVASAILKQGFIVGTFNFRGAGSSKGRTSWHSKAEQDDYISFIGFMTYYLHNLSPPSPAVFLERLKFTRSDPELHDLSPVPSQALPPPHTPDTSYPSARPRDCTLLREDSVPDSKSRLLLAGYSYGAMITSSLPPIISSIIQPFQTPLPGSPQAEIRMRADGLAEQQNSLMNARAISLLAEMHSRSRDLQIEDHILSSPKIRKPNGGVRIGGEEDLRRASHESFRSRGSITLDAPERVRKSVDRVRSIAKTTRFPPGRTSIHGSSASSRKKQSSGSDSSIEHVAPDQVEAKVEGQGTIKPIPGVGEGLQTAYLLISPLHGWATTLATMWSSKLGGVKDIATETKFTVDPTLAVFGDDDSFVSVKRLRTWVERLSGTRKEGKLCQFRHREVSGAGHFWHDHEAIRIMQEEVKRFVGTL